MGISTFKSGDIILIVSVFIVAALFMAWNAFGARPGGQRTAVILHNSQVIKSLDLSALKGTQSITLHEEGVHQVIRAEKGKIRFLESDCPQQTCVKTGWLIKPGDQAVCIPARVVIKIVGENKQVDVLAY
ncbi:MAG: NusG domain II-containing protein [Solirubrobacterales bacterium]